MRNLILLLLLLLPLAGAPAKKPMREVSPEEKRELVEYLKTHWKSPEDYVVGKFSRHDIVFIGEWHRVKHDVELIQNLIPRLYEAGVYNLGIEFGACEYQDKVDALINTDEYGEDLARWLMFKSLVTWGYQEYMGIYRKAWELNKSLPKQARKFRVINLDYRPDWTARKEEMTPERWRKVWHKGSSDEHMAKVIVREFVDKGQKALIYSGAHHAFTRYHQPVYDFRGKRLETFMKDRMGNLVYRQIPDRVFNIFLHSPWPSKKSFSDLSYPVGGVIDQVMEEFVEKRVGFDVKGSPFGQLRDDNTYYGFGYQDFRLSTFTDGYIFQKHFRDYEGVRVDPAFITEENLQEAIDYLPDPEERKTLTRPEDFIKSMRKDADMRKRLRGLE